VRLCLDWVKLVGFHFDFIVCHMNACRQPQEYIMNSFCRFVSRCLSFLEDIREPSNALCHASSRQVLTESRFHLLFHLVPSIPSLRITASFLLTHNPIVTPTKTIYRNLLASRSDSSRQRMSSSRTIVAIISPLLSLLNHLHLL